MGSAVVTIVRSSDDNSTDRQGDDMVKPMKTAEYFDPVVAGEAMGMGSTCIASGSTGCSLSVLALSPTTGL